MVQQGNNEDSGRPGARIYNQEDDPTGKEGLVRQGGPDIDGNHGIAYAQGGPNETGASGRVADMRQKVCVLVKHVDIDVE